MQREEMMKEAVKYLPEIFEGFSGLTEQEREGIEKFVTVNNHGANFRLLQMRYHEAMSHSKDSTEALRKAFYSQYLLFGGIPGEESGNGSQSNVGIMKRAAQQRDTPETGPNELAMIIGDPEHVRRTYRQKVYSYLVTRAFHERTTTYAEIAARFDFPTQGNQLGQFLSPILSDILRWCELTNQPKITSLVVRKSGAMKALPGDGFWNLLGKSAESMTEKTRLTKVYQDEVFDYFRQLGE